MHPPPPSLLGNLLPPRLMVVFGLCGFVSAPIHAFEELGKGELIAEVRSVIQYDSNIFADSDETEDLIGSLYLGIAFEQTERSLANLTASAAVEMMRFADLDENNAENFYTAFEFSYPNGVERNAYAAMEGSFDRVTQSRSEVGQRLESDRWTWGGEYRNYLNSKSGVRAKGALGGESFLENAFSDSSDQTGSLDFLYRYSSKLNLVTGYRYRKLDYNGLLAARQTGHVFKVGAEGDLRPKVTGSLAFGAQWIDGEYRVVGPSDDTQIFYELELDWKAKERTTVTLSGSSDFQSSPTGEINNRKDLSLAVAQVFAYNAEGSLGFTVARDSYEGILARDERSFSVDAQYLRLLSKASSLGVLAQYERRDSDFDRYTFDSVRIALNLIFRF